MSGGSHYPTSNIREVINKHGIGQGRKTLKSEISPQNTQDRISEYSSFNKTVTLHWNSKTSDHRKSTSITIPSNFWKTELFKKYSDIGEGSFLKIKVINPLLNRSGIHTFETDDRHRITLTSKLLSLFGIRHQTNIEFRVQGHIPPGVYGNYPGPVTCISNFTIYNNGMLRVNVPEKIKKLTGLSPFQEDRFIHCKYGNYEGVGRLYPDTTGNNDL